MKAHAAFAHSEHINQSIDGENQHGNCEESGEEDAAKKAPAKKAAAKKAPGQEGGGEEGAGGEEGGREAKAPAKKRTPNAAFMKAMTPSGALAAIIGDKPLPRTEVTKKVWEYIKKNEPPGQGQADDDQRRRQAEGNLQEGPGLDVRDDQADQQPPELSSRRGAPRPRARKPVRRTGFFLAGSHACRRRLAADARVLRLCRPGAWNTSLRSATRSARRQP
jgi:hypothetical protein